MFDAENLKKLFYYCLKRTGNRERAEDLAGDISLEIITMLDRGYEPENFNAWMWTVAKAKYAKWAKAKNIDSQNISGGDISDYNDIASDDDTEDAVIKNEEIALLRRELSIMSKDYREITVAYYIENKKISDISETLGLPEGTVKRKLFESRKYLKEGIKMTRQYGKRSYSPDNVNFNINRTNPIDNVPYSLISSKFAKNILLEAYTNPCSTEELSISLGVASPYLEEELEKLTEGLLLVKTKDNKYETDFIILDAETQKNIRTKSYETAEKIYEILLFFSGSNANLTTAIEKCDLLYLMENQSVIEKKYVEKYADIYNEAKIKLTEVQRQIVAEQFKNIFEKWKKDCGNFSTAGVICADEAMWFYLFKTVRDSIYTMAIINGASLEYQKKYKGEWTITGLEEYKEPDTVKYSVGHDWDHDINGMERHLFKFYFTGLNFSREKPELEVLDLFKDILKTNRNFTDLTNSEKIIVEKYVQKELAVIKDGVVRPAFPIIFTAGLDKLNEYLLAADFPDEIKEIMKSATAGSEKLSEICYNELLGLYEYDLSQIKIGLPERLFDQAKSCARDMVGYLYEAVLKLAFEKEYLPVTDKPVGIGAYIVEENPHP